MGVTGGQERAACSRSNHIAPRAASVFYYRSKLAAQLYGYYVQRYRRTLLYSTICYGWWAADGSRGPSSRRVVSPCTPRHACWVLL